MTYSVAVLQDRARQIAATAVLSAAAVAGGFLLDGIAVAALCALAAYGVAVFVLGLANAGVAAATVVATLAVVALIDAGSESPPPPERAQLRQAEADLERLGDELDAARRGQVELRRRAAQLRDALQRAQRRASRSEGEARRLRRRGR